MPTLKDIQEEMTKRFDENFEEVILDQEVRIVVKGIKLFIESEISLAFQAGEKSKEDMVLKEIEDKVKSFHEIDCHFLEDGSYLKRDCFQAGEKSKEDMVLKEIEDKVKSFHEIDCHFLEDGSYLKRDCTCGLFYINLALSSLKEKIISDNQK